MSILTPEELAQKEHYDNIGAAYHLHYADVWSLRYRDRFFHAPMIEGLELSGLRVLDAMAGAGEASSYLIAQGAEVTGLDISPTQMSFYQENCPEGKAVCGSMLNTGLPAESFDLVLTVGGLHHLPPHLEQGMDEIYRLLKPGGMLCFVEPHKGSLPDRLRKLWYRFDPLFEESEESVDLEWLKANNQGRFESVTERYLGSVAYIAVLNSMILRVPGWVKNLYSPILMNLEGSFNRVATRALSCYALCQWRKI